MAQHQKQQQQQQQHHFDDSHSVGSSNCSSDGHSESGNESNQHAMMVASFAPTSFAASLSSPQQVITTNTSTTTTSNACSVSPAISTSSGNGGGGTSPAAASGGSGSGRKRGRPLPEDLKDEAYWERRRKNNEAAKRSRDLRRAKEDEIAIRAAFLEQENFKLKCELMQSRQECDKIRALWLGAQQGQQAASGAATAAAAQLSPSTVDAQQAALVAAMLQMKQSSPSKQ